MSYLTRYRLGHRRNRSRIAVTPLENRCVPATISGQVFKDLNANGTVEAGETGLSGVTVFLDANNNGINDPGPTKNYASTDVPKTISSSGSVTVTSTLSVADAGKIFDVNVKLNITHSYDSDLTVSLKSPAGTSITLFAGVGTSTDNFTNTVLDDEASVTITSGSGPFTGSYKPSPGALSSFDGQQTNGTWTLTIIDGFNLDGGSLNSWSIDIQSASETATTTNASGNYSFAGLAAGTYNVAHTIPSGYNQTFPGGDGRHHVTLAAPDTYTGNFGDRLPPATISGLVFNDLNSNGTQQGGEPPVAGVTVYLDLDKSGTFNGPDQSTTTNGSGQYSFTNLEPNIDYIVAEVLPGGFTHIAPIRNGLTPVAPPGTNVNTTKRTSEQTETSIAIDPSNPNRVFMASNEFSATGMAAAYSTDGGSTWTRRVMATGADIIAANGDPSAAFDSFGNLWITYLSASGINTVVARSTNGGQTFSNFATIANGTDQCTLVTGPSNTAGRALVAVLFNDNGGQNISYLEVNAAGPIGTFTTPVLVPSSNSGISGNFGDVAIGPNGQVAVTYVNSGSGEGPDNIYFNLDPDGIGPSAFGARSTITATNVGAFDVFPAQPSRSADSEPDLEFDTSGGPFNGRLYLVYTDETANENNDLDIRFRYSTNNGASWSSFTKINNDATTRSQFLPRMDVDQTTGHIAFSWYDCRNDASNVQTEVWATASFDGGATFQPNIKLSVGKSTAAGGSTFDYGDYTDISFTNGRFISAWGDNSNSTGDNPNGASSSMDVYIAKVTVASNQLNHLVSTLPGQTYANRDFAIKGPTTPAPTVTIDQKVGQADPTNGTTIDYTVVFSAPVSDFATGDVLLSGTAGATTAVVTGSGTTYNVAVSGMTTSGTVIATIPAGVATDGGSGNLASTSTDNTVTFDVAPPTATTSAGPVNSGGATSYQFDVTYIDNVAVDGASLDSSDIRVTGPNSFDVAASFVSVDFPGNGATRVVTYSIVTPGPAWDYSDNGTYSVVLQNGQVLDSLGNAAAGATVGTFSVNVPPLTVTIDQKAGQADPTNGSTIDFTVIFISSVSDFDSSDVNLSGTAGATTAIVTGSGNTYNVAVSGMTTSGTVIATIPAGVATDSGTSKNLASGSTDNTVTFDIELPAAVSTPSNVSSYGDSTYKFDVTYSDNVAINAGGFDGSDVRVTGPGGFDVPATFVSVDTPGNGSPRIVTYSITPPGGFWDQADNGTYSVVLQGSQIADTAGNTAAGATLNTFDVTVPGPVSVTDVQVNDDSAQRSMVTSLTITFSGPVTLPTNPEDAFELTRHLPLPTAPVILDAVAVGNVVTLEFIGGSVNGTSLADGRYTLKVFKSQVNNGNFNSVGTEVPGNDYVIIGDPATNKLFRLFADGDGNGTVNSDDFAAFRGVFGTSGPGLPTAFDYDEDTVVDSDDFAELRKRFGISI